MIGLVIGIGNLDRGDDAVGIMVARRLADLPKVPFEIRTWPGDLAGLIEEWSVVDVCVVVDAMQSGSPPGTVRRLDEQAVIDEGVLGARTSTHSMGLAEVVALAREIDRLPGRLVAYGIEVSSVRRGADLSPQVDAAVNEAAVRIAAELAACSGADHGRSMAG